MTSYPGPPAKAIRGPDDVLEVCKAMARRRQEHFVVLLLNARHELQRKVVVSKGSLNASIVHPREVFLPAIKASAASIILVHNHPSGVMQTSGLCGVVTPGIDLSRAI